MSPKKSISSISFIFALLASLMATAISAQQTPPDGDPDIRNSIEAEIEVVVIVPVFDPHLCYSGDADGPFVFNSVTIDQGNVTGGNAWLEVCVDDTMSARGPYALFLLAENFTLEGSTTPIEGSASRLRIMSMSSPVSTTLTGSTGKIYSWSGGGIMEPLPDTTPFIVTLAYSGENDLAQPRQVGLVSSGGGTTLTVFPMELQFTPDALTESGVYTTTIHLDVYSTDTP